MSPPRSPCPPLRGVPGVSALMSADHQEGVEHNPEIAPLQTEFEALQAEFEQPKRDFEAKLDEWSERAEPVWKAIADDLEERAPDVAELRTNSTWHADEDDDPLFDSRREYLEQIDPGGSRACRRTLWRERASPSPLFRFEPAVDAPAPLWRRPVYRLLAVGPGR